MGKKSAPPPPDYTPIAQAAQAQTQLDNQYLAQQQTEATQSYDLANSEFQAQQDQAAKEYALQQQALQWAQGEAQTNDAQNAGIVTTDIAAQKQAMDFAKQNQDFFTSTYMPLAKSQADYAAGYDTPEREQQNAGSAMAGVTQQVDAARVAAAQNLEAYGVDPSSTRYAALDIGTRTAGAAAAAGAGNTAILNTQQTGQQLQEQAINTGMALASGSNASLNTGINAGNAGGSLSLNTTNTGANTMGTSAQYGSLGAGAASSAIGALNTGNNSVGAGNGMGGAATGAIGAWGNTLNMGYSNQLDAFKAQQSASSGLGSLFGTVAGLGKDTLGGAAIMAMAGGGAVPVPAPSAVPTQGGAIPTSASPSNGRAIDDVPARLTAGEFVIPRDVMQWKGEEQIQKLIMKSRKDRMQNSPARPQASAAPAMPAAFMSRPAPASALPTR